MSASDLQEMLAKNHSSRDSIVGDASAVESAFCCMSFAAEKEVREWSRHSEQTEDNLKDREEHLDANLKQVLANNIEQHSGIFLPCSV